MISFSLTTPASALTNSVAETTLIGTGAGNLPIATEWMQLGRIIRIHMRGTFSTTAVVAPTLTIRVKLGTTTINTAVAAANFVIAASSNNFECNLEMVIQSTGSSGTILSEGTLSYSTGSLTSSAGRADFSPAVTTIDTTTAQTVNVTAQWGTASPSNTITTKIFTIEPQ